MMVLVETRDRDWRKSNQVLEMTEKRRLEVDPVAWLLQVKVQSERRQSEGCGMCTKSMAGVSFVCAGPEEHREFWLSGQGRSGRA